MSNANRTGLIIAVVVVAILVLFAFYPKSTQAPLEQAIAPVQEQAATPPAPLTPPVPLEQAINVPTITAAELAVLLASDKAPVLVDVREPAEFMGGSIKGAISMPLASVPQRMSELSKDKPIVVYCRSGRRSAEAAQMLIQNGFTDVKSLTGGYTEWSQNANNPVTGAPAPAAPATPPNPQ